MNSKEILGRLLDGTLGEPDVSEADVRRALRVAVDVIHDMQATLYSLKYDTGG